MSKTIDKNKTRKAVFLDRDGTLIEDRGCLQRPDQVQIFRQTAPSLIDLQKNFLLFMVTNQNGVSKGLITRQEADSVSRYVAEQLADQGVKIQAVYTCPHQRSDDCDCIKPHPLFARRSARTFNLSLPHSFSIGDHPHDAEFGKNFGGTGLYVLTGHGKTHADELTGSTPVFPDIRDAADWILFSTSQEEPS
jgi:D-glycero-D-manno-heptose 1,7-bisphosphate phosphatase